MKCQLYSSVYADMESVAQQNTFWFWLNY